jgi:hypothetical protein
MIFIADFGLVRVRLKVPLWRGGSWWPTTPNLTSSRSVFAVLKRGIIGVYHSTSKKHLGRYVDEFTFRLNDGNVKVRTLDRLDSFVVATAGKRITYKELTH